MSDTIQAQCGGVTKTASVDVQPASLASIQISPTSVVGKSATIVKATIKLNGQAGANKVVVSLSSSNPSVVSMPSSVTIAKDGSAAVVTLKHSAVTTSQTISITATFNGAGVTATLSVTPK